MNIHLLRIIALCIVIGFLIGWKSRTIGKDYKNLMAFFFGGLK